MGFTTLPPGQQRALIRLVLTHPYLRDPKGFAQAAARIVGEGTLTTVETARRLRYAVYKECGIAAEGQGWVSLLVTSLDALFRASVRAWGDRRLSGPRRTAIIGVREDGRLFFMGGPNDKQARRAGWVRVRPAGPGWAAGWEDCPPEPAEAAEPLEPEEEPQPPSEPAAAPQAVPLTLDTLMPLVLRAMRAATITRVEVSDDPNLGPRVFFEGTEGAAAPGPCTSATRSPGVTRRGRMSADRDAGQFESSTTGARSIDRPAVRSASVAAAATRCSRSKSGCGLEHAVVKSRRADSRRVVLSS